MKELARGEKFRFVEKKFPQKMEKSYINELQRFLWKKISSTDF